jgi:plasmid maintenance system antidote protein VapI
MKPKSFSELYEEAERHEEYWIAGAILEFTESLVQEMQRQDLTRTELAKRLGATPAYVTKLLRGKANFTIATMVRLARALGTEIEVRLGSASRRVAVKAAGHASGASAARIGRSHRVATTAGRPAALRSKPIGRKAAPAASKAHR